MTPRPAPAAPRRPLPYPTWRGVALLAAGGPLSVALAALVDPSLWKASLLWIAGAGGLVAADALTSFPRRALRVSVAVPSGIELGGRAGTAMVAFARRPRGPVDLALEAGSPLAVEPPHILLAPGAQDARFGLVPSRRGRGSVAALHLRWRGPLGLAWTQTLLPLDRPVDVTPRVSAVRDEAVRLFSRTREAGTAVQTDLAASTEFHALREFQRGDDSRAVSWRQSARHATLLVRETRAERNRAIVFALDTGRLMSEPVEGSLPRVDHAINGALLMAYVGLKVGDRVGLFAFDARPVLSSGAMSGVASFAPLQRMAASLDYSTAETNFTLGLTRLGATLGARALVVVFTEFADATGARLMVDALERLTERHRVLFVAFRDAELEDLVRAEPREPADVSRAAVAGRLLRERETVLGRLRRLGVEVLDVPARAAGPALVKRYLALKRENAL